jgi:NO-binding membrane sensor protein with MHYT domain
MDDRHKIDSLEELRSLAGVLRGLDTAASASQWNDDNAMRAVVAAAHAVVALGDADDIGATTTTHSEAEAAAIASVGKARIAVAEAVLAVDSARHDTTGTPAAAGHPLRAVVASLSSLGRSILDEVRHITADRPRSILLRIVITVGVGLALVAAYHLTGMKRYDLSGLTLYLFSVVVGSVVCTNSLCFEAERVRTALAAGQRVWRVLVVQNIAMAVLITIAGLPVIAALTWTREANPVALVDQLVTMVFIWLGVGNVLSVLYPLRHEPMAARLKDGTWKPFLFSFVLSYGVGLTVNLMIYWRLWARQTANAQITGGAWMAFVLVLASAILSWMLLTVFAVACSQQPIVRRKLSREMIAYRQPADS